MIDPRIIEAISKLVTADDNGIINGIREDHQKGLREICKISRILQEDRF
jgi:hypothetical protein